VTNDANKIGRERVIKRRVNSGFFAKKNAIDQHIQAQQKQIRGKRATSLNWFTNIKEQRLRFMGLAPHFRMDLGIMPSAQHEIK